MNRSDVTPALRPEQPALSFMPRRQNAQPFAGLMLGILLSFASAQTFAATFIVDNAGSQDDGDALAPGNDDNVCDIDPITVRF